MIYVINLRGGSFHNFYVTKLKEESIPDSLQSRIYYMFSELMSCPIPWRAAPVELSDASTNGNNDG